MIKQIEIYGQCVKLHSSDKGRTWSSSPQAIFAYGLRKQMLLHDLQKGFERIDEMQDPDPNGISELKIPKNLIGR